MNGLLFVISSMALCLMYAAWREHRSGNLRDFKLLAIVSCFSLVISVILICIAIPFEKGAT